MTNIGFEIMTALVNQVEKTAQLLDRVYTKAMDIANSDNCTIGFNNGKYESVIADGCAVSIGMDLNEGTIIASFGDRENTVAQLSIDILGRVTSRMDKIQDKTVNAKIRKWINQLGAVDTDLNPKEYFAPGYMMDREENEGVTGSVDDVKKHIETEES